MGKIVGGVLFAALIALSLPALAQPAEIPDPQLTPGVVASTDAAEVCGFEGGLSYSKRHRQTTQAMKMDVLRRYGITGRFRGEIDHLIPLCAAGKDDVSNLWPQSGEGLWSYHVKDEMEAAACRAICHAYSMTPQEAQALFVPDWRVGYCILFPSDERCAR